MSDDAGVDARPAREASSRSANGQGRSLRSRTAHAGAGGDAPTRSLLEPIHQGAAYAFDDAALANAAYANGDPLYARDGLPNVRSLERAVADLEGADAALAVSSGMAAITLAFMTLLRSGDQVVAPACGYCDTSHLLQDVLGHFGVGTRPVDVSCLEEVKRRSTYTPVWSLWKPYRIRGWSWRTFQHLPTLPIARAPC